jgi:DNA polymerase-1
LAVDATNIAHRAFHTSGDVTAGVVRATEKALAKMRDLNLVPTHLAMCLDTPGVTTWRHEAFPDGYKAHRSETDPALAAALAELPAALAALGLPVLAEPGIEADDLIASVVEEALSTAGGSAVVLSADRDLLQLAGLKTLILAPRNGGVLEVMNRTAVETKYGVPADRYRDFAALRGDKSDGLPGVRGIGEKKAALLLNEFGDCWGILAAANLRPADVDAVAGKGIAAKIIDPTNTDNIERNIELMDLVRDLPVDLADLEPSCDTDLGRALEVARAFPGARNAA